MLVEQKRWGGTARNHLWSSTPERMLQEWYDPEMRRDLGGMHCGSRMNVIPITAYECGYIYPTVRTLNGERAERWMSCFAASLAEAEVRPQGEFLESAQKSLNKLSPEQKIFADIASVEVLDAIRLLGRHTLGMLRGAGQHILESKVSLHEVAGDQLRRDGAIIDAGSTVRIAPAVVDLIGNEALHTCAAVNQLMHLIYPESVFDSARPVVLPSSGPHLVYKLAVAVAALPEADFAELYHSTPGPPTGLAPFFRVISPEKLVQISLFELQGWTSSKEIEPFGTKNESYEQLLAARVPLAMDRPFIPLLTLRHLHAQRAWGAPILDALATVGYEMLDKGFLPEKESFRGVHHGVELANGSVVKIEPKVAHLVAFYRHAAWLEERNRSQRYDDSELRRPTRVEHVEWNPAESPDDRYIPDVLRTYASARAFAKMRASENPEARALYELIRSLGTPDSDPRYVGADQAKILATGKGCAAPWFGTAATFQQQFVTNRFSVSFLALKGREPGSLVHGAQRPFDQLPVGRQLFESLYGRGILDWMRSLDNASRISLSQVGAAIIKDPVDEIELAKQTMGEPLPLSSGDLIAFTPEVLTDFARKHKSQWIMAEQMAFELSGALGDRRFAPPGKPAKYANYDPRRIDEGDPLLDKNRGHVYGHAVLLAALEQSGHTQAEWAANREGYGWPAIGTVAPLSQAVTWETITAFSKGLYRARQYFLNEQIPTTVGLFDPIQWRKLPKHEVLNYLLYSTYLVDFSRYLGRAELSHLREIGERMIAYRVIPPENGTISALEASGIGLSLLDHTHGARVSPLVIQEITEGHARVFEYGQKTATLLSRVLNDRSLRPEGYERIRSLLEVPVSDSVIGEKALQKDRAAVYALAYVIGALPADQYDQLWQGSYFTGRVIESLQGIDTDSDGRKAKTRELLLK